MKQRPRFAFYGGTFDPVHCGHVSVARALVRLFSFDRFFFLPAYHAPHKPGVAPTSAYHRYAMLVLATRNEERIGVSTLELEHAEKRYTIDTMSEIKELFPESENFFVMGADSWTDIRTWREWETLLLSSNHVVVTRPGYNISLDHVTEAVRRRVVDLRNGETPPDSSNAGTRIYVTDAVEVDVSATEIRNDIRVDSRLDNTDDVPDEVAKYIEKYELYK